MPNVQNKTTNTRVFLSIELLKTFTQKEMNGFKLFIDNKYVNADAGLPALLQLLIRYVLKTSHFTIQLQIKIYNKFFGEVNQKQTSLNKKQSGLLVNKLNKLLRLAEKFLMMETLNTEEHFKSELLFPQLIERKQMMLYKRHLNKDKKLLDKEVKRDIHYHNRQYKLQESILTYLFNEGLLLKEDNFNDLQYHLDIQYLLQKLRHHLAQLTLVKRVENKNYDFSSFKLLQPFYNIKTYSKNSLIQIYQQNIDLIETENDATFNRLINILTQNQHLIHDSFLEPFYTNLSNYCARQIRNGKMGYYKNLTTIYKQMWRSNLLVIDDLIDIGQLKNIVTVSCRAKEFEWVYQFIEEHKNYIHKKVRDSVYYYNLGVLDFNKGDYKYAHQKFTLVNKINDTYEIGLRIFILRSLYETEKEYSEPTAQMFDSLKTFFSANKKLSKADKVAYLNFITVFFDLYRYRHKVSGRSITSIKNKLYNLQTIQLKNWLLTKIKELENLKQA